MISAETNSKDNYYLDIAKRPDGKIQFYLNGGRNPQNLFCTTQKEEKAMGLESILNYYIRKYGAKSVEQYHEDTGRSAIRKYVSYVDGKRKSLFKIYAEELIDGKYAATLQFKKLSDSYPGQTIYCGVYDGIHAVHDAKVKATEVFKKIEKGDVVVLGYSKNGEIKREYQIKPHILKNLRTIQKAGKLELNDKPFKQHKKSKLYKILNDASEEEIKEAFDEFKICDVCGSEIKAMYSPNNEEYFLGCEEAYLNGEKHPTYRIKGIRKVLFQLNFFEDIWAYIK